MLDFGLGVLGYNGCWDDARFAEERGFTTAGFVDSPLLGGETFACMALAARATSTIRLGPFLAVPSNRSAPTTAQGVATINRLAPGRTFLALGTGYTSRNTFGLPPIPAAGLAEYARECRALLDGGVAEHRDGERVRGICFQQGEEYISLEPRIPVYVAGDGPKALAAVRASGDGWVTTLQYANVMENAAEVFAAGLAAVGDPDYTMWSNTICVLDRGERPTSDRVLRRVGAYAMMPFQSWADNPGIAEHLPLPVAERLEFYRREVLDHFPDELHNHTHRGHLSHLKPGEEKILTDEIVRMTTLTGSAEEIAERLQALEAAGLDNLSIWAPPPVTREVVTEVVERIMPLL